MAAVAARLGVAVPSLYKHVGGLDVVQRLLATQARAELTDVLARAAAGLSGAEALTAVAGAYRRWAHAHPGRYAATLRAPDPADDAGIAVSNAALDVLASALRSYRLQPDQVVDAVRALRAGLHGFVALELAGGFGLPQDVERSFDLLVAALSDVLSSWPPAADRSRSRSRPGGP